MEIVSIEKRTFDEMAKRFEEFAGRVDEICRAHNDKAMSKWLDNQEVCQILNISPRTLQTLRDNGTLAFSQIYHKAYYLPEDVMRILPVVQPAQKAKADSAYDKIRDAV